MRQTDTENKTYFRSSQRVFRMNESWYFSAREGDQGPFNTEPSAVEACRRYISDKTELAHFQAKREAEARAAARQMSQLEIVPFAQQDQVEQRQELSLVSMH